MTKQEASIQLKNLMEKYNDLLTNEDKNSLEIALSAIRMTQISNFDRIKKLAVWELADFIYQVSSGETTISVCKDECKDCKKSRGWCISEIAEWLERRE